MKRFFGSCLPALGSGFLLWASFPPLDLGFLAWIALVPLTVSSMREEKTWRAFLPAWLGGTLWFTLGFQWVRHTVPVAPYLLGLYMGLYPALYVWLTRRLTRHFFPLILTAPVVWAALEYVRGHLFTGLPWFLLGYTQHRMDFLIQIADLGGVYLVGALVVAANAVFSRAFLVEGPSVGADREFRRGAVAVAALLAASLAYGGIRVSTIEVREGPEIVVVQPNVPQDVKLMMRDPHQRMREARAILDRHVSLMTSAAREGKPALFVWPESVIFGGLVYDAGRREFVRGLEWHSEFLRAAAEAGVPILLGVEVKEPPPGWKPDRMLPMETKFFNSVVRVEPVRGITDRYDKMHLVPFAEYLPLAESVPLISDLIERYSNLKLISMSAGREFRTFPAEGGAFGVTVCFEEVFPEITRELAGKGAGFVVNISNEGWFQDSAELDQMHAMARFRAVECRVGHVRATNTGISSFFSPTGEAVAVLESGGRRKEVEGVLRSRVRETGGGSFYRNAGDAFVWLCCGFVLASLPLSWTRRRGHFA